MFKIFNDIKNAHLICGDDPLSLSEKIYYFIYHSYKGILGNFCLIKTRYFHPKIIENSAAAPGRKYLNQFIREIIPNYFSNRSIKVLDVGCGKGYVRNILYELGYTVQYTGIDIYKNDAFDHFEYDKFWIW